MIQRSDEHLVGLIASGDRSALEELYERYFDLLFKFSLGFLKSEDLCEDVVQEVFISLIDSSKSFDSSRRFRTWILSLTANRCKNVLRTEKNRSRILQDQQGDKTVSMHNTIDREILKEEIRSFLSQCTEKEQMLYHLRFEMDMTVAEVADVMNIPAGSVKSGLFYLIKKLKKPLTKINHEFRK